jgi:hypothetical protein
MVVVVILVKFEFEVNSVFGMVLSHGDDFSGSFVHDLFDILLIVLGPAAYWKFFDMNDAGSVFVELHHTFHLVVVIVLETDLSDEAFVPWFQLREILVFLQFGD